MSNKPSGRNIQGRIINNKQQIEFTMINYVLICPVVNEGIDFQLVSNYYFSLSGFLNCRAMHWTAIHTIRITAKRMRGNRYIPSDKMPPNVVNEVRRFITTLITEIDVKISIESTRLQLSIWEIIVVFLRVSSMELSSCAIPFTRPTKSCPTIRPVPSTFGMSLKNTLQVTTASAKPISEK